MCEWIRTANPEEQKEQTKNIVDVINKCNELLNEIKVLDPLVTPGEIVNGFRY